MGNTAHCYLDKRYKQKETGAYNVKLCIYINGDRKNYRTNINLTKEDWKRIKNSVVKDLNLTIKRKAIEDIEKKAKRILGSQSFPTFEEFAFDYYNEVTDDSNDYSNQQVKSPLISLWFQKYSEYLKTNGHPYSYYQHYTTALNSFLEFKQNLTFSNVTTEFIRQYRLWYTDAGSAISGCNSYLRDLRTVFNYAIEKKAVHKDRYPFGKGKYRIGNQTRKKKALKKDQIINLRSLDYSTDINKDHARDVFIFQYLCNGMNLLDICKLKLRNFDDDLQYFTFSRNKTKDTSLNVKQIRVFLRPESQDIIHKWGNRLTNKNTYIFPFFDEKVTDSKMERDVSNQTRKNINKYLKRIGVDLGLSFKLTIGIARHSFASVQRCSGTSIKDIADMMGHENTKTTTIYLDDIDDDKVKELSSNLL